ncbi:hypothetical protein A0H81_05559 [Grifola frondosa]|uniref:Uncharacterized protein n=1 Tax=Grifola frondosa TaxID=5627 RepID=A0A1C7MH23_GRIFR|nr:hypothetical protein A0H81_05559 [Grifola frondosa]
MNQEGQALPSAPSAPSAPSVPPSVPTRHLNPKRRRPVWIHKAYGLVFYDDWLLEKAIEMFGEAEVDADSELRSGQCMMLKTDDCEYVWRRTNFRVVRDGTTWRGCVSLAENNTLGLDPKMPPPEVIKKLFRRFCLLYARLVEFCHLVYVNNVKDKP